MRSGSVTLRRLVARRRPVGPAVAAHSFGDGTMSSELDTFVRDALARGLARAEIRDVLLRAGWREEEIDGALARWAEIAYPIPVPRRRPYLSAREAFLYLVLFATLYVVAFNAGAMLFVFIEHWFPDLAKGEASRVMMAGRARFSTASVLIGFPIYLFVSRVIGQAVDRDPEKRSSKVRKWLTYLTLFLAALVMIGDLISLVSGLLSGEVAPRFLLKSAVVFAIAGVVFGHYLGDLRRDEADRASLRRSRGLARAGAAATVIVALAGLWFSGSPREERKRQFDNLRLDDLRSISDGVDNYWRENRALPANLDEVAHFRLAAVRSIQDPTSRAPYEYRTLDSLRYELCATFDLADTASFTPERWGSSRFWNHGPGRHCFELRVPRDPKP